LTYYGQGWREQAEEHQKRATKVMAHWANTGLPMGFRRASLCGCASTDDDAPVTLIGGDNFLVPMKHGHVRILGNQSDGAEI